MNRYPAPLSFVALLFVGAGCAPTSSPAASAQSTSVAAATAAETITAADMLSRITFLASDELQGRDTPSPGLETAAAYLAGEHRRFGLEPAGENSTYYQRYPFVGRGGAVASGDESTFPANIVALLRGSDPVLRDEYVVLSAHYDHVGIGRAVAGDSIYNGADDNASGTSALLEVAEALSGMRERPRRSIIFLHVSGEEHGLFGSQYYSNNPTVPVANIVANINVDMIGRNAADTIVVIGKSYSSLGDVVERAGARHPELGLTVSDDLWPQERFFYRSDHYNFARLDIPAVFFFAGVHEDYHQPSDHVDKIDPDKAARVARLIFFATQDIANETERPEWDPAGLAEVRRLTR